MTNDYDRIERAIHLLRRDFHEQPKLDEIAKSLNLSPFHFQRLFRRWAGISPKRFLQFLTVQHAKKMLKKSQDLLNAAYDSGLSSPGRLHDLFVVMEAATPGEFKAQGQGITIRYGFHPTPFGECLAAVTARGICSLSFVPHRGRERALRELRKTWKGAVFHGDSRGTRTFIDRIFRSSPKQKRRLALHLRGSNFQIKVWEALLKIPPGRALSYEDVAARVGRPKAARAVGTAVAHNPIGYLIPCHRVIQKSGMLGNYRWGKDRKAAILAWETSSRSRY